MSERPTDACGVVGLYGIADAARIAALGLHALQHRGQESAGIVTSYQGKLLPAGNFLLFRLQFSHSMATGSCRPGIYP